MSKRKNTGDVTMFIGVVSKCLNYNTIQYDLKFNHFPYLYETQGGSLKTWDGHCIVFTSKIN